MILNLKMSGLHDKSDQYQYLKSENTSSGGILLQKYFFMHRF